MKVLIAIDNSPCSSTAFNSVAERAWPDNTEFRIINVMEPIIVQYVFPDNYVIDSVIEAEREMLKHCREFVDSKVAQLRNVFNSDKVSGKMIEGGIADSILTEAEEWSADLIIVGSHGRKGFQRFLLGSVAEKVASHAPCSVEIVKEKLDHEKKKQNRMDKATVA
jgi:nucleotide-binding universal stress UspA family protein